MMRKKNVTQFWVSLLMATLVFVAGQAFGLESSVSSSSYKYSDAASKMDRLEDAGLLPSDIYRLSGELWPDKAEKPTWLVQADADKAKKEGEAELSPECIEARKDPDADIGEMLRSGCQPTTGQMARLMDNPLGNVAMLFTQFDVSKLENPVFGKDGTKVNYMGIAQFPKGISKNWNLINRIVWNVPSMPIDSGKIERAQLPRSEYGSGPGEIVLPPTDSPIAPIDIFSGRTTGFGDMYYNGLFSLKEGYKTKGGGNLLWGLGFDLGFPTATDDLLGTGKWLAGPSGLGVYMGPKWKVGALAQTYWSYAGDSDRDDVSLLNLQYFIFYNLDEVTAIGASPNIIANFEQDTSNRWTVPIGLGIVRTFQFGKLPVRIGAELHYSVVQPDTTVGTEWNFRFYVIPAVPSAMFKWMQ